MTKILNHKGSTLQVVLILFLVLLTNLLTYANYMAISYKIYHYEKLINTERDVEVLLKNHYRKLQDKGLLHFGSISGDHSKVSYLAVKADDYIVITTKVKLPDVTYRMVMKMEADTLSIKACTYL
jgi:hypothetical protein